MLSLTICSAQMVWRIDGYKFLMSEAKIGKKPSIFSPPFYSAKYGYKLAASIALFGDGPGALIVIFLFT